MGKNKLIWILLASLSALPMGYAEGVIINSEGRKFISTIPIYIVGVTIYLIGFRYAYHYIAYIAIAWETIALSTAFLTAIIQTGGFELLLQSKTLIGLSILIFGALLLAYGAELLFMILEQ